MSTTASACSFYTTFLPTFHAASTQDNSMEDHPENLPILDRGATHCLLPITWLGAEECEKAKKDSPQSGHRHHSESFCCITM